MKLTKICFFQVQAIVDAWSSGAKNVVEKLRQRSVCPKQLEAVNWRLHLQMAQKTKSKMKQPAALFELVVNDDDTQVSELKIYSGASTGYFLLYPIDSSTSLIILIKKNIGAAHFHIIECG